MVSIIVCASLKQNEQTVPPPSPLRIAILECDIPIGNTREEYGGYGNLFKELLLKGKDEVREGKDGKEGVDLPELDVTKFNVVDEELYPRLEEVDVVLVSGSRFNSFDDDIWILKLVDFVKKVLFEQERVRLVGVCFGHQIIGRALGQKVGRSEGGWEISVTPMQLTEKGKEVFGVEELVSFFLDPSFTSTCVTGSISPHHAYTILPSQAIHQMHQDAVFTYPPSVEHLGHSPSCHVQGMYERKRLITTQGHPEFDEDIVAELLENRHDRGVFDDRTYEDAMRRVKKHHDGVRVAGAFLRFMVEE
ncbi:hypothetical protein Q7P36_007791 [Cladosporium allicinum]